MSSEKISKINALLEELPDGFDFTKEITNEQAKVLQKILLEFGFDLGDSGADGFYGNP